MRWFVLYLISTIFGISAVFWAAAHAEAPGAAAFGTPPNVSSVAISPDGGKLAILGRMGDQEFVSAMDLSTMEMKPLMAAGKTKGRNVEWADNETILFWVSVTRRHYDYAQSLQESAGVYAINSKTGKNAQLLRHGRELAMNSSIGTVISMLDDDPNRVLMTAFGESKQGGKQWDAIYSVFEANVRNGTSKQIRRGDPDTTAFIADEVGKIYARVDFSNHNKIFRIVSYAGGQSKGIYEIGDASELPFNVLGLSPDKESLVVVEEYDNGDVVKLLSLDDGSLSEPVYSKANSSIAFLGTEPGDGMVRAAGFFDIEEADWRFLDPRLEAAFRQASAPFEGYNPVPVSWSDDMNRIVLYVGMYNMPAAYYVYDVAAAKYIAVLNIREGISKDYIADVMKVEYKARDGQQIEAVLTKPLNGELKNAPTVVLPHGGPASADNVRWDWLAQFFAVNGYAVFQPNFRGSIGYGRAFENAGYGEWGRGVSQHDVTDGLKNLIAAGITDPDRVCILGASYGGYSALAGAAFTPDLYKCVVAIAPVADLPRMMRDERRFTGRDSWVVRYWQRVIQGRDSETHLRDISPAHHADAVQAPVLLLHGDDDTVVPLSQSRIMEDALKAAGKDVELIVLKDEDHWLSNAATRIQTLEEAGRFIDAHIGGQRLFAFLFSHRQKNI